MGSKMAFQRLHMNSNSRVPQSSNSSTSSRNEDAVSGVPDPSPRRTLRKNPPTEVPNSHSNFRSTTDTRASAMRRRLSTRERSATMGARPSTLRVVPATPSETPHASNASLADISSSASECKSTTNLGACHDSDQDDKHALPEGNELKPINFDDFHNSIMSKEPTLNHFPLTAQSKREGDGQSKPTARRRFTLSRPRDRTTDAPGSDSNSSAVKSDRDPMGPPPAPGRRRRQSFAPVPSSAALSSRQPRKSIGPGMLVTDTEPAVKRRPSLSRKHLSEEKRYSSNIHQDHSFLSAPRTHKARSLQPPPRTAGDNLAPGTTTTRASSNTGVRTPVKNRLGAATPSSTSSKRMSIMPSHATGLGARTISPTDARRMKRMSLIPQPPPIPRGSPTQQETGLTIRPRSAVPSPSMIPRKSVTPSSNRTTPDPNRKSYSSGLTTSSNTTPHSVRNSNSSLQARLSQNLSSSRLPTAKPRHENGSNEEDVPPVPAIPKDYKPHHLEHFSNIILRKSSLPIELVGQQRDSKDDSDARAAPVPHANYNTPGAAGETVHSQFGNRHKPAVSLNKKNLQPLKLPPLNLLPLGDPMATKIDALKERQSRYPTSGPPHSPPLPLLAPKTPTTPLTASKANFFPYPVNEHIARPMTQTRSNSSHFTPRAFSTAFRADNSSSALDNEATDYITAKTPKAPEWNYIPTTPRAETPKAPTTKPAGPRPQTQISEFIPLPETSKLRHVSYGAVPNNGPPSPRKAVEPKKSISRFLPPLDTNADRSKYESMPPPKLPASATWSNFSAHQRTSPTPVVSQTHARRRPSVSIPTSAAVRRNQSINNEQNATSSPSEAGDVDHHTPRTASMFSPAHRNITSRPTSSPKPRAGDFTTLDRDDLLAEEQMRKLGSSRRDFELAAKELTELRRRASPKERATPPQALKVANLNIFERGEIIDFKDIFFCGTHKAKKHVGDLNAKTANFGYDDERGDYNIVTGDHIAYRYEIVDILGKGSFGQVVRCVDHKTGQLVAIKIIRNKKRFHQQALVEVNILKKLRDWDPEKRHSVVNFTQSFYFRGHLCISTELLGMNLYELIKAYDFRGFSSKVIRRFTKQMLGTLLLLEAKKVVHCDLKPENILMVHPMKAEIKVIDFGSSCFENEKVYTYIQSRFYRSPEVILGMSYGMPIDMWSLGCILAELYTGYPLFPGENEQEQLGCIMEIFGPPEKHLIEKSTRKKLFFDSQGKPRLTVSSKGRRRKPSSKDLRSVLKCDDDAFVDFVARCLRWDPARRLTPHDALKHEFISGMKMPPRTRSYLTSSPGPKRLTSGSIRPLPDPPSATKSSRHSPIKHKSVPSNPLLHGGMRRTTTHGPPSTSTNLTSHAHPHAAATGPGTSTAGSALPRVAGRKTSARPDLAAAAAATSLVSPPSNRSKRGFSKRMGAD